MSEANLNKNISEDAEAIYKLLAEIIKINSEMFNAGLVTPTGGNVSARLASRPEEIWITPSKTYKGELAAGDLVPINLDGEILNDYATIASSERFVHCEIYRSRTDVNAVIHTHAPNVAVLDLAEIPFTPISPEATFIGEIPITPFIMPGTKELGVEVASSLGDGLAVIMQNHGLVVAGTNLRHAADITHIIEETAGKILASYRVGKKPRELTDADVKKITKNKGMVG